MAIGWTKAHNGNKKVYMPDKQHVHKFKNLRGVKETNNFTAFKIALMP